MSHTFILNWLPKKIMHYHNALFLFRKHESLKEKNNDNSKKRLPRDLCQDRFIKIATGIVTCSRHVIVAALHQYLSHKDNRDFIIWHKAPIHGQNNPVQKKE